jgi:hypothetical protein
LVSKMNFPNQVLQPTVPRRYASRSQLSIRFRERNYAFEIFHDRIVASWKNSADEQEHG